MKYLQLCLYIHYSSSPTIIETTAAAKMNYDPWQHAVTPPPDLFGQRLGHYHSHRSTQSSSSGGGGGGGGGGGSSSNSRISNNPWPLGGGGDLANFNLKQTCSVTTVTSTQPLSTRFLLHAPIPPRTYGVALRLHRAAVKKCTESASRVHSCLRRGLLHNHLVCDVEEALSAPQTLPPPPPLEMLPLQSHLLKKTRRLFERGTPGGSLPPIMPEQQQHQNTMIKDIAVVDRYATLQRHAMDESREAKGEGQEEMLIASSSKRLVLRVPTSLWNRNSPSLSDVAQIQPHDERIKNIGPDDSSCGKLVVKSNSESQSQQRRRQLPPPGDYSLLRGHHNDCSRRNNNISSSCTMEMDISPDNFQRQRGNRRRRRNRISQSRTCRRKSDEDASPLKDICGRRCSSSHITALSTYGTTTAPAISTTNTAGPPIRLAPVDASSLSENPRPICIAF